MSLTDEERSIIVAYRIEQAYEDLEAAKLNADHQFYNTAGNRLYYAAFHAVSALLIANGIEANTHSGVKNQLGLRFVKTGKLSQEDAVLYNRVFRNRQTGDFTDKYDLTAEDIYPNLAPLRAFIAKVESLIKGDKEMNAHEQFLLGNKYFYGQDVPIDVQKGLDLWKSAAERGCTEACQAIGLQYASGEVVEKDYAQAIYWLSKVDDRLIQWRIARMYDEGGHGIHRDWHKAVEYYQKSARKGWEMAQNTLKNCGISW